MLKELRNLEKGLNNRLVDFVIWWSYLNDYRTNVFEKLKKIGLEAYAHILGQIDKLKEWYHD